MAPLHCSQQGGVDAAPRRCLGDTLGQQDFGPDLQALGPTGGRGRVQGVERGPTDGMVPSVRLVAVEMTRLFGFVLDIAPAMPTRTREEETTPTTRAAAEERREIEIRGRAVRLV